MPENFRIGNDAGTTPRRKIRTMPYDNPVPSTIDCNSYYMWSQYSTLFYMIIHGNVGDFLTNL